MPNEIKWSDDTKFVPTAGIQTADYIPGLHSGTNVKWTGIITAQSATPYNTGYGYQVFNVTPTGTSNSGFGFQALKSLTTGSSNTAIGYQAANALTTGAGNTVLGTGALNSSDQSTGTTLVGVNAGNSLAAGFAHMNNSAFGTHALGQSLSATQAVNNNNAFGINSIGNITSGNQNSGFGSTTLSAVTSGSDNTGIGYNAGATVTTGSQNTFLGSGADSSTAAGANRTGIGYNVTVSTDNYIVLGNSSVTNIINAATGGSCSLGDSSHRYNTVFAKNLDISAQSQALNMNSNLINNLIDPLASSDAATKNYVDMVASGLNPAISVLLATTANIPGTYNNGSSGVGATFTVTATGALTIDGVTAGTVGGRYLLKDLSTGAWNGIYTLTTAGSVGVSPVFTRASDYNQPSNINNTGAIPILNGTANNGTLWVQTATITTVGTDALSFSKFGTTGTVTSVTFTGDGVVLSSTPSSAVTSSGTLTATIKNQNANLVLAGPTSGGAAAPSFRSLVATDIPDISATYAKLSANNTFTKRQAITPVSISSSSGLTPTDGSASNYFTSSLTENTTLQNPTNLVAGTWYTWVITQNASTAKTVTLDTDFVLTGPAWSMTTTLSAKAVISGFYDGTNILYSATQA